MAFRDLREYIASLNKEGEVQVIQKEVDWNLELGAVIRRSYDLGAPAPFFQKITGHSSDYRVFGAPVGLSRNPSRVYARVALALGMNPGSSMEDIIEEYVTRSRSPIKPVIVSGGPCKENVHVGLEVDLEEFPAPFLHEGDGGRYIGSWHTVVTKDPDTGWVNWGTYRLMVHDKTTLGCNLGPNQHAAHQLYQKYEARGMRMEFAIAIGTEPVTTLVSATKIAAQVHEVDLVGALRREPVELVRCETVDLTVPAASEIVIEGEVLPGERKDEGPFGEFTGYRVSEREPMPVFRVKAITHRHQPILPVTCVGVPVDDGDVVSAVTGSGEILAQLRERGYPVRMVYCPPEGVGLLTVVSTKVPYPNFVHHLALNVWGGAGRSSWYLIVVDDDIDATNMKEVTWALASRCHPDRGITKTLNVPGHRLLSFCSRQERNDHVSAYALMDCTWPKTWHAEDIPVRASFDVMWPKEIQARVLENWKEYGYGE